MNYDLGQNYALDASVYYRFRYYDNPDSRNDSDLRWKVGGSRAYGEKNLELGARGRTSYRGNGNYRNDYGLFTDYRYRLDPENQLIADVELQRLGALSRTHTGRRELFFGGCQHRLGPCSERWKIKHLADCARRLQFATSRPDGDSLVYGLAATYDFTFTKTVGGFLFGT